MDHVHFRTLDSGRPGALLSTALAGHATWSHGEIVPAKTTILVAGRVEGDWSAVPALRAVVVPWAGVPRAVAERVGTLPGVELYNIHHNAQAVAEHALSLLLSATRRTLPLDRALRGGDWSGRQPSGLLQLSGKTACVLGYGSIGRRLVPVLHAMGMRVIGVRRSSSPEGSDSVEVVGVDRLAWALGESNVLVVLAPSTPDSRAMIGAREIRLLKPPRVLVNVGRGDVIQESALVEALSDGTLHGAGIDVWYRYPKDDERTLPTESDLSSFDNLVMSPHVAGHSDRTEELREAALAELLSRLLTGVPAECVDVERGY